MIELEVKIPDKPGTLIKLIQPISDNSGNIHGILHTHKEKSGGYIPVLVTFDIISGDKLKNLENIKKILRDQDIQILKITDIPAAHQMTAIFSGHVFRQDFEDTVIKINSTGAKVHDLEAKFTKPEDISNVKFLIEIPDEIDDEVVIKKLRDISMEKNLFLLMEEML
ncbi:MAG: hypothetical protein GY870_09600 [archaeon]|nr:hypothetical protein [archaeon]